MFTEWLLQHWILFIFFNRRLWVLLTVRVVIVQVVSLCRPGFFFFHPGTVLAVHNGRFISCPLFALDFCSNCGSNLRHGGHRYIPWESTGYPKVIIVASWNSFCFLFSWWFPWVSLFKWRTMCIIISIFLFSTISQNTANNPWRPFSGRETVTEHSRMGRVSAENKIEQVFLFWNCVYSRLHVAWHVSMNNRQHNVFPEIASRPC